MRISVTKDNACEVKADLLIVPVFTGDKGPDLKNFKHLIKAVPGLGQLRKGSVCDGAWESSALIPGQNAAADWVLVAGLGKREDLSLDRLRRMGGSAALRATGMKVGRVAVVLSDVGAGGFDGGSIARCIVEGMQMALSPVGSLKSAKDKPVRIKSVKLVADGAEEVKALRAGAREGEAYAAGCLYARHLVDLPGNLLTPKMLADRVKQLASDEGYSCRVFGPAQLKKMKMGGILGVAQGSHEEPRMMVVSPRKRRRNAVDVVLVGKGITFDAGGISLKPPAKMADMKYDMAGAAAVLGAALTVSRMKLSVNLTVIVPSAENMPAGDALKPGDVITMGSGKTVEVLNTDAEGRLILADALHYACGRKPDYIIDAATLTGACAVALGPHFAGLMSHDSELIRVLRQAGGETFERVWHLPLIEEHQKDIKSSIADIKNLGGGTGGAMAAGAFLAEFVGEGIPWAHLDIAGTAWAEKKTSLGPAGGTGYGARLMARAVEILAG